MWKLHPSDRAVEQDPPVCVWNRRIQPHLHLRGPRTQVTGNQRRSRAAVKTFRPSLSASFKSRICQSISGQRISLLVSWALLLFHHFLPLAFHRFALFHGLENSKKKAHGRSYLDLYYYCKIAVGEVPNCHHLKIIEAPIFSYRWE